MTEDWSGTRILISNQWLFFGAGRGEDIVGWCRENFGERDRDWRYRGPGWLEFRHEQDAALFLLRWS